MNSLHKGHQSAGSLRPESARDCFQPKGDGGLFCANSNLLPSRVDSTKPALALAITEAGEPGHVGQVNLHFLYHENQRIIGVLLDLVAELVHKLKGSYYPKKFKVYSPSYERSVYLASVGENTRHPELHISGENTH